MLLPAIVNLDGFYLSFTREPVEIPNPGAVERFLPPFDPENLQFRASLPVSQAVSVLGGATYSYFRYECHLASMNALQVHDEAADAFEQAFGRRYGPIEAYRTDDADIVFVMMGSFATKAKAAVDRLVADMAYELQEHQVAVLALYPGLVRTERVLRNAQYFDMSNSESPQFTGRAVAALAADPEVMTKSGQALVAAALALEYGFKDIDGKQPRPLTLQDVIASGSKGEQ